MYILSLSSRDGSLPAFVCVCGRVNAQVRCSLLYPELMWLLLLMLSLLLLLMCVFLFLMLWYTLPTWNSFLDSPCCYRAYGKVVSTAPIRVKISAFADTFERKQAIHTIVLPGCVAAMCRSPCREPGTTLHLADRICSSQEQ